MTPSQSSPQSSAVPSFSKQMRQLKLVFWGPGSSGKTTLIRFLSNRLHPLVASNRIEISTSEDHTLLSDYLAIQLPLNSLIILLHVVTTTGQRRLLCTREFAAAGADGILFIADSQQEAKTENCRSYEELRAYLAIINRQVPVVIMANKQDLPGCLRPTTIRKHLQPPPETPVFGASALDGTGVQSVFQRLVQEVLAKFVAS
ncbi:MAG: ATP/GTP-binding protein [Promethearchaeota archaeon]